MFIKQLAHSIVLKEEKKYISMISSLFVTPTHFKFFSFFFFAFLKASLTEIFFSMTVILDIMNCQEWT